MLNNYSQLSAESAESKLAQVSPNELAETMQNELAREMDFNPLDFPMRGIYAGSHVAGSLDDCLGDN